MLSRWPRLPNVQPLQGGHGQECQLQQHSGCRRVDGRVQISLLRQVRIKIENPIKNTSLPVTEAALCVKINLRDSTLGLK